MDLEYKRPLDWQGLLAFLAPRSIRGVESVEEGVYRRAVPGGHVALSRADDGRLVFSGASAHAAAAKRLFALDADPAPAASALGADPDLQVVPGLRVPGCWDGFELAVRAIVGQQVSVKGAATTLGRLAAAFGEPVEAGHPGLTHLFPAPDVLAEATIEGMPRSRANAIRVLAGEVASGSLRLEPGHATREQLLALPGIGPWTAEYVAMRALGDADAWLSGDLGVRHALARMESPDPERWRPYRAYAAMLLWRTLAAPAEAAA